MSRDDTKLRPDFALQMWMRTLPKENPHEQVEYNILLSATQELKRLYTLEMLVEMYVEHPGPAVFSVLCEQVGYDPEEEEEAA